MKHMVTLILSIGWMTTAVMAETQTSPIRIWAVDPLVKVFRDAEPQANTQAIAEAARGEHATLQVVVRCPAVMEKLQAKVSPLVLEGVPQATLTARPPRFVGYVPVERPTPNPSKDQLRKPPADYPDPLLEKESIDVTAKQAQPIWITLQIPQDAKPGVYTGTLTASTTVDGKSESVTIPLSVRVYDVLVARTRLWNTNWFGMCWYAGEPPKLDNTGYWDSLRQHARAMADHRQNVAIISPMNMCVFRAGPNSELQMDFSSFDKAVQLFIDEGVIGRIEGAHIAGRAGGWVSQFVVNIRRVRDGKVESPSVDPSDPDADRFYKQYLPALVRHLREKGWLDRYMQHIGDEPINENLASYKAAAALVRKYAPELRIIEACHAKDLVGSMDIWVPMLNYLHNDYEHYRQRQKQGEEVWFYTCVQPQGEYANRFMELPLIKTRILHWINYRYGITGYLHWGYNFYNVPDPYRQTTTSAPDPERWPAGDAWLVYPGPNGPIISIRWEAMRDGIVDYELLSMLAERDPKTAMAFAERHVKAFDKYQLDLSEFRATRRELLERLSREQEPSATTAAGK